MPFLGTHGRLATSWWGNTIPTAGPVGTVTTWMGVRFHCTVAGRILGFRFYDSWSSGAPAQYSICQLMDWATPRLLHRVGSIQPPAVNVAAKWNQIWVRPWFRITPNHDYYVVAFYIGGGIYRTNSILTSPVTHGDITFVSSSQTTVNDVVDASLSENTNANAVDILFQSDS
jgi:hypothetical protein